MAGMRLTEIMTLANSLAGCAETPPDSQVYLDGEVRRVFCGIDIDVDELLLAKSLGVDGVIGHHPIGSRARLDFRPSSNGTRPRCGRRAFPRKPRTR
jgi:hypothetical protein